MMRGRPLAFMVLVVTGWGTARVVSLLPAEVVLPLAIASEDAIVSPAAAEPLPGPVMTVPEVAVRSSAVAMFRRADDRKQIATGSLMTRKLAVLPFMTGGADMGSGSTPRATLPEPAPAGLPPQPEPGRSSRWSASGWAIVRDGGGGSLLTPLLGGSQAGVRVAYRLDDSGRIAMFARAATPLKNGPAELAAGAQWRPTRAPVTVYAEVRATDGQAYPAVGLFGGGAVALPARFRLEGYGQAGLIDRDGISGFGDAQVRVVRPIGPIEAGAGAWGAAQRGASRVDIGPSLALPIAADPLSLRVTLDWRHRVAGNARPDSGPVLSLGADF